MERGIGREVESEMNGERTMNTKRKLKLKMKMKRGGRRCNSV